MAIWQYTFRVFPEQYVGDFLAGIHSAESGVDFDDEIYWRSAWFKRQDFSEVGKILPRGKSWSDLVDLYGNEESNCFEVVFDEHENILSVSFRIDFRENYGPALESILGFFARRGFLIVDENLLVTPFQHCQVKHLIESSTQFRKYLELSN